MKIEIKNKIFEANKIEYFVEENIDKRIIMLHHIKNKEYSYNELSKLIGKNIKYKHNTGELETVSISKKHIFLTINLKKQNDNIIEIKNISSIIDGEEVFDRTITLYSDYGKEIFKECFDKKLKDLTTRIWCSDFIKIFIKMW